MSNTLVFDCPSCGAINNTFDVNGYNHIKSNNIWELLAVCRKCKVSSCIVAIPRTDIHTLIKETNFKLKGGEPLPSSHRSIHLLPPITGECGYPRSGRAQGAGPSFGIQFNIRFGVCFDTRYGIANRVRPQDGEYLLRYCIGLISPGEERAR